MLFRSVLEKVITVRNTILKVNQAYIQSAAMEDAYRIEPSFKLQGSYREMNKLVTKIVPIMNNDEMQRLLLSHYESERTEERREGQEGCSTGRTRWWQ